MGKSDFKYFYCGEKALISTSFKHWKSSSIRPRVVIMTLTRTTVSMSQKALQA